MKKLRHIPANAWRAIQHFHLRHEYDIVTANSDGLARIYCAKGWECSKYIDTGDRLYDVVLPPDHPRGLFIHTAEYCAPFPCAWHRPSNHHMRDWQRVIRMDRYDWLTERICPEHGVGHPDPDTLEFFERTEENAESHGVHGCCGCCHAPCGLDGRECGPNHPYDCSVNRADV